MTVTTKKKVRKTPAVKAIKSTADLKNDLGILYDRICNNQISYKKAQLLNAVAISYVRTDYMLLARELHRPFAIEKVVKQLP